MSELPAGFAPPDLTQPQAWFQALGWLASASWWWLVAFASLALALGALRWASARQAAPSLGLLDEALGLYALALKRLPLLALALAMVGVAVGLCSSLAARTHHREQAQRAALVQAIPEGRMAQQAPSFGHWAWVEREVVRQINGKATTTVVREQEERHHHLGATEVQAELKRLPDPVHPEQDLFALRYVGLHRLTNPTAQAQSCFVDLPGPEGARVVANLKVALDGQLRSPTQAGGTRYAFDLPAHGSAQLRVAYEAQGLPRWVYDTQGARLSRFKLSIRTDAPQARFASGVAPNQDAWVEGMRQLVWDYPENATISEPVGLFTAVGDLGPSGFGPRWFLLAPALLPLWCLGLACVEALRAKGWLLVGGLFLAAVVGAYALQGLLPLPMAWALPAAGAAWLTGALGREAGGLRVASLLCLVLPGAALAWGHAAWGLGLSGALAIAWLCLTQGPASGPEGGSAPQSKA